ncbi:hypothetical protein [uncultured Paludibaculum sp.]|uniref:hypothetical protein n=1 Tax=uncultured Paludibaculum sp. TaxID=1765020 RepID=UPI002AABB037|nr:hypothetical protein [uncultured Paludibaculum sp.]
MLKSIRNHISGHLSDAQARVMCYLLGPVSGALILRLPHYGAAWAVRFHAFHATLMAATWGLGWGALRVAEEITPWFLSTVARELRLALNLGFVLAWVCLVIAAYQGRRCAVFPTIHRMAVHLARKTEGHTDWSHVGTAA